MRIALVYPSYWPYVRRGVERYCHDLSRYLAQRGHSVDIITSKPGPTRERNENGVRILYLGQVSHPVLAKLHPLFPFYSFGARCLPSLLDGQYDVAHTWTYPYGLSLRLTRWLRETPYAYHTVVTLPHLPGPYYLPPGLDRWMFERTIEGAACVAVLNRGAVAEMRRAWHREASLLPAPVDVRAFRPCAPKDLASPKVLFTADLSDPRKGGILLLRAWNFVHQRCPQAILVLAGPHGHAVGARRVDLLSAIPSLVDVPARKQIEIRGPGSLEELPGLYSQSAVTVLPSIDEPFGMVLTESLACGTPVVCSQEGGPGEIVTEPEVGTTVPLSTQQDLYSMTRAMQLADAMLEGIELAGRPGTSEHCRAHAQQWSLDVIGRATETMYEDVVSQARQRSRRRTHSRTPRPKPISV